MNPLTIKILAGAAIVLVAFSAGWAANGWRLNTGIQKDRAARAETTVAAIGTRVAENVQAEAKHTAINQKIEVAKNEELAPVVRSIAAAPRVRVGASICPAAAGTPAPQGPSGGDVPATGAGVVSESADRDLKALMVKVEEALATGRACQGFIRENGLIP